MTRRPNKHASERVHVTLSAQNVRYLAELARLGVHGVTAAEVARHFVENEIERMILEGFIDIASGKSRRRR